MAAQKKGINPLAVLLLGGGLYMLWNKYNTSTDNGSTTDTPTTGGIPTPTGTTGGTTNTGASMSTFDKATITKLQIYLNTMQPNSQIVVDGLYGPQTAAKMKSVTGRTYLTPDEIQGLYLTANNVRNIELRTGSVGTYVPAAKVLIKLVFPLISPSSGSTLTAYDFGYLIQAIGKSRVTVGDVYDKLKAIRGY